MRFDFILLFRMLNVNTINCHFTNDICWDLINKSSKHLTIIIFFSPQNDGNKITQTHTHNKIYWQVYFFFLQRSLVFCESR